MKENAILLTPHDFVSPPTSAISNFIETSIGRHRIVVPRVGRTERRPHSRRNTIRIGPLTILYPYQPTERASPSTFLFTGPFRCQPDGLRRHATNCVVLFHRGRTTRFFFFNENRSGGYRIFWVRCQKLKRIVKFITRVAGASSTSLAVLGRDYLIN